MSIKDIILMLVLNVVSLAFVIGAVYLASINAAGWGWFVFAALLTFTTFSKS